MRNLLEEEDLDEDGNPDYWDPDFEEIAEAIFLASEFLPELAFKGPVGYRNLFSESVSVHAETGDDHVCFTNNVGACVMESVLTRSLFGPEISIPDTYISSVCVNYAEKFLLIPTDVNETYSAFVNLKGENKSSQIIDLPAIRSALPVGVQNDDISTSLEGKCGLVARSLAWSKDSLDEYHSSLISIIQDVGLSLMTNSDKFPYLPNKLGGYDKPFPLWDVRNVDRVLYSFKRGKYSPLIRTIIARSRSLVYPDDGVFVQDPFLERVKKLYSGFQPWYQNYRRSLPSFSGLVPQECTQFSVGTFGLDPITNQALRRLKKERVLYSETDLIVANEVQSFFKALINSDGIEKFKEEKREREKLFRAETVLSNSFQTFFNDYVEVIVQNFLSPRELEFAVNMDGLLSFDVAFFLRGEQFYRREALDLIYMKSPLKIDFPLTKGTLSTSTARERKQMIPDPIMDPELEKLMDWILTKKEEFPPQELLEDDPIIHKKILDLYKRNVSEKIVVSSIIITDDKKLCRKISEETAVVIFQIPTRLFNYARRGDLTPLETYRFLRPIKDEGILNLEEKAKNVFVNKIKSGYPQVGKIEFFEDTGSIASSNVLDLSERTMRVSTERRTHVFTVKPKIDDMDGLLARDLTSWPSKVHIYDPEGLLFRKKSRSLTVSSSIKKMKSRVSSIFNRDKNGPPDWRAKDSDSRLEEFSYSFEAEGSDASS